VSPAEADPGTRPERVVARLTWLGHSTVLIDVDGARILTDPLLRNRVAHLRRVAPVDTHALRGVDTILLSHVHYDHLDLPSLERLGRSLPLVVPRGAGAMLRKRRFEHVVEVEPGEEIRIGDLSVRATHAEHDADRGPLRTKAPSLGFVVAGSTRTVYFAGDTDLFDGMRDLGGLDVALLPVWGWGPSLGPGHLDPRGAAEALELLRPRIAVPIHWGTYYPLHAGRGPFLEEPPEAFRAAAAELAPEVDVRVIPVGGSLDLASVASGR
jgi:L-ascorbate metabolism protein UlaG (beta-lactamase superfamily)